MTDNLSYVLYGHPRSGNAYKTALMLSMTGTPYEFEAVDLMTGGNLEAEYLKINPLGKVPALVHGDLLLRQSHDTLRYLAEQTGQFGPNGWAEEARIGDWIGYQIDFLGYGVARLRFERLFGGGEGPVYAYFQVTADRGMGMVACKRAMEIAIEKAKNVGMATVVVPNGSHFGAAGYYARMALEHDMIGLTMSSGGGRVIVPLYGKLPWMGTNPIAFAAPADREPP